MIWIFDLAYLCDVHPDDTVHYNIDCICMFDINLIQLDSFIMDTNKNLKNIHISHDVTPEERKNLRKKKRRKRKMKAVFAWYYEDIQGLEKLSNISFPEAYRSRKEWKTQVH